MEHKYYHICLEVEKYGKTNVNKSYVQTIRHSLLSTTLYNSLVKL